MSMSKKDFIALADQIRSENAVAARIGAQPTFSREAITVLADFCKSQNYNFMRGRWLDYIDGKCGKNGGAVK